VVAYAHQANAQTKQRDLQGDGLLPQPTDSSFGDHLEYYLESAPLQKVRCERQCQVAQTLLKVGLIAANLFIFSLQVLAALPFVDILVTLFGDVYYGRGCGYFGFKLVETRAVLHSGEAGHNSG